MLRVLVSPAARNDLLLIWDYIAADDPRAADRIIQEFEAAFDRLSRFPELAPFRPDLLPLPVRVLPLRSYLIVYRISEAAVEIARVVSGYRDLAPLFGWE